MQEDFQYSYYHGTNRLWHTAKDDGDNYQYDPIGNLTKDLKEGVDITWNPYGKVRQVSKSDNSTTGFRYDAAGNRIAKLSRSDSSVYVRDASGNVMAIYKNDSLVEHSIYGSSRLGLHLRSAKPGYRTLGHKTYELSNHLGNVLATVRDRIQLSSDSTWAEVSSISDFYPFGLTMPGRSLSDSTYRYGFNGKENDSKGEWGNQNHYDYGFRIYNPSLGKFLSVDPLASSYPMLTPYQYASNTPIASIDLEGAEGLWYVYAKSGMYGEKTSTIINATEDGVKLTVLEAYEFLTKDAYKISTWKQLGYLLEEVILSSSPYSGIYNPNTPQLDALVNNFEINVINGDLYSRTKVLSSFSTGLIISALSDKGLGKLSELSHLSKFKNGASKLMSTGQLDDIARRFPDSEFYGDPRGTFVAPASEIDELLNSGASRVEIAERLGITDDLFLEGDLIRIDVSPKAFENLRIPTGSESGVNNMFKSGGRTSGGVREGILNNIRKKSSNINTKIVNEE